LDQTCERKNVNEPITSFIIFPSIVVLSGVMVTVSARNRTPKPHGFVHGLFDVVVILKGLNGLAEIAGGTALLFLQAGTIMAWVDRLTQAELIADPKDHLALFLQHWAMGFSHDSQVFAGFYLLAHGIIKVLLAVLLFMEKAWAFPLAVVLFSLLVTFSIYRLSLNWSWILLGFVILDLFTIWLIAKEWRAILTLKASGAAAGVETSRDP
jgi:uncharacterized membrane protein